MSITDIKNYLSINDELATAGQPTADQFAAIRDAGFEVVLNVGVDGEYDVSLDNEGDIVNELGMTYINVPILWKTPHDEAYSEFVQAMNANRDKKIFLHCIANYRATAMLFLYQVIEQEMTVDEAQATMHKIWKPHKYSDTWHTFINEQLIKHRINLGDINE